MTWTPVGVGLEELQRRRALAVEVEGRPVLLLALGESVRALSGSCPHAGADLEEGTFQDGRLVCPLHGATYDLSTGEVLIDPHGVEPPAGGTEPLRRYAVRVQGGRLEVDLAEP